MVEVMESRSIDKRKTVNYILSRKEWYDDMLKYKLHGEEPNDPDAVKRLRREEHWYVVYQGLLYRKSFSLPLFRCAVRH